VTTALSRWRPSPGRALQLVVGLWLFGLGEALIIAAELGNSPWTVLSEGVSRHTPLSVGSATVAISFVVLMAWVPLRQRPGLGTVLNAVLIGVAIDVSLALLPDDAGLLTRALGLVLGILMVGLGSALYLTAALGPGPRDGLMTGLHRRTGASIRLVRAAIEVSALVVGVVLGGTVGIGTVAFALGIGPVVQHLLPLFPRGERPHEL